MLNLRRTFHLQRVPTASSKASSSVSPSPSTSTQSSLCVFPPPSTSTLSSRSVVPPPSTSTLSSLCVFPPPSTSTLSSRSVVPPPSTSTLSSRSVVPPPSTSTLSSLSVVLPSSSTSTLSSRSVVPPPSTSTLSSLSVVLPSSSTSTLSSLSVVLPSSSSTLSSLSVVPTSTVSPTSTQSSQRSTSVDDCVGPDNVEGYGAVQELAEFLFGLRDHQLALSGEECAKIITLWQALGDFDKSHKNTLKQGRFRATKKIVAPGVESTKRCFIGAHSPAHWPNCNRVVEAIFTRLCDLYKNTLRCEGVRVSQFKMVIRAYKHIRECVITNAKVMTETTIQLPEVNVATVTQWFSRRCRSQEQQILKQGIPAPDAPMAGPEQLLVAMQKGTSLYPGSLAEPHTFVLPPNTAVPEPSQVVPGSSQMMLLNMPLPSATQALTSSQSNVPYTTQQYRKRKEEREQSGTGKRKYVKKTDAILCKKYNKDRKPPAHLQYFGNWYCQESETQSYEDWRAVLEQRGYGEKKRGDAP
ncbi:Platelet glycoprotein Ib alpha chain [Dissostichus eleginoides]|uniref:Platelet glycoprotein Ib alpha chain n=1 Tax=Dissostichus eleginoides TaxID=100907 RepID=A0AAD9BQA4_DISEL|nr:Platelet glycoprotein Ib alpha chain [Dissostichus eleginoides]